MSFPYTELFTTIGAMGGFARNNAMFRASTAPVATSGSPLWGANGAAIHDLNTLSNTILSTVASGHLKYLGNYYSSLAIYQNALTGASKNFLENLARSFLTSIVNENVPLINVSYQSALAALVVQMRTDSQTVKTCTVTSTVTAGGSNIGNAQLVVGLKDQVLGVNREYLLPETITATVTKDANSGATAGQEPITLASPALFQNRYDPFWPGVGSATNKTLNIVNPMLSGGSGGNLLTNSSFETYAVANTPDSFSILVGSAGTSINKSVSVLHASYSTASLQFVGDGAELTSIAQVLTGLLSPSTTYAINGFLRGGDTLAAGVLAMDLVDGSNTVINDNAGNANTISRTLATSPAINASTWVAVNGFFRTPAALPAAVKLRLRLSTALANTKQLFFDDFALTPATELYKGGSYAAAFRGATNVAVNDTWSVAVTNTASGFYGAQTVGLMQTTFNVLFDMRWLGLQLPSSGSPSLADSLVA